jgi:hypothetical protein
MVPRKAVSDQDCYDWKVDCSGLDNAALTEYESPNQLCPASVHSQQKAYNTRKVGLLEKFKKAVM